MATWNKFGQGLEMIIEEETMPSSPGWDSPLRRTHGAMMVQHSDDEEGGTPRLNTNTNRQSDQNNHSEDSDGSDNETFEKLKAEYGSKSMDVTDSTKQTQLEEIPESKEIVINNTPTWDTMLMQLNKLPGDAILLLADVRAVMLSQSHWNLPYPEALGHVLLAWQMLRSGCYAKDCRVWLRKRYQDKPFKQQPFTTLFGIAGFCIRRKRKTPEYDGLGVDHRDERLQNNLIEYTGYSGSRGRKVIRRINSKKDERTERYKGTRWEEVDRVVVRWDNSGYHTSGHVVMTLPEESDAAGGLRRHASLPSHSQSQDDERTCTTFTVADCLKPGQKNFSPPNKRIKRHNSDSTLCPGKASQVCMGYSGRPSSDLAADKTSSEDLTKEELWNRAMAEVSCQNITSNNSEIICVTALDETLELCAGGRRREREEEEEEEEEEEVDHPTVSPAASVTSPDWSVGSRQSSSDSCCHEENSNCAQCGRRPSPTTPGFYSPQQITSNDDDDNDDNDDEVIQEIIEADDTDDDDATRNAAEETTMADFQVIHGMTSNDAPCRSLPLSRSLALSRSLPLSRSLALSRSVNNDVIVSKMKNSLTLCDRSTNSVTPETAASGCDLVSPRHVILEDEGSGDSMEEHVVSGEDSSSSVAFHTFTRDTLHHSPTQDDDEEDL